MQLFSYILCITDFILPQLPHGGFFIFIVPCSIPQSSGITKEISKHFFFYIAHLDRSYSNVSKAKK